jgi:hypothetical protein
MELSFAMKPLLRPGAKPDQPIRERSAGRLRRKGALSILKLFLYFATVLRAIRIPDRPRIPAMVSSERGCRRSSCSIRARICSRTARLDVSSPVLVGNRLVKKYFKG